MKNITNRFSLMSVFALIVFTALSVSAQTTEFTYQGRLTDTGTAPTSGVYDFEFALFSSIGQVGTAITREDVQVTNGVFTVQLDFGSNPFTNNSFTARFLEIRVRPGDSTRSFTPLSPRQALGSSPYAIQSMRSQTAATAENAEKLGGAAASSYLQINGDGSQLTNLNAGNVTSGVLSTFRGGTNLSSSGAAGNYLRSNGIAWQSSVIQTSDIPNLDAAKITTGTFAATQIPNLDAAKITSGIFNAARIPDFDAAKITSGFLLDARLSSNIPRLNTAQTFSALQSFTGGISTTDVNASGQYNILGSRVLSIPGANNIFVGLGTGAVNTNGSENAFFGRNAGSANTSGSSNTFIGYNAGNTNTTGSNNTLIGAGASLNSNNLSYATAIGAGASAFKSNTITMGRSDNTGNAYLDDVEILANNFTVSPYGSVGANYIGLTAKSINLKVSGTELTNAVHVEGKLRVTGEIQFYENLGGTLTLCYGVAEFGYRKLGFCGSSLRYKSNVENFNSGLDLIKRLRPVTFNWKSDNSRDLGFVAEEVNAVEPLMTTYNSKGEVEGVKYDRISAALVNAVNEQQTEIEQQRQTIESLRNQVDEMKKLVCELKPQAAVCRKEK